MRARVAQRDYFAILGVSPEATEAEVRQAYRRLARRYHPDLNPDEPEGEARLKELNEAYEVLSDPTRRAAYEAQRRAVRIQVTGAPRRAPGPPRPPAGPPTHVDLTRWQRPLAGTSHVDLTGWRPGQGPVGGWRPAADPWGPGYPRTEEELLLLYLRRLFRKLADW